MEWELEVVGTPAEEPEMDPSGIYALVHRDVTKAVHKGIAGEYVKVRVDLMKRYDDNDGDQELYSFIGNGSDVRKAVMAWLGTSEHVISLDHAAYIGFEICRAESEPAYMQD